MANRVDNISPLRLGQAQEKRNDSHLVGRAVGKTQRATQNTRERWKEDRSIADRLVQWDETGTPPNESMPRVSSSAPILGESDTGSVTRRAKKFSKQLPPLIAPTPLYPQSVRLPRRQPFNGSIGISGDEAAQQGFGNIPNSISHSDCEERRGAGSDEESSDVQCFAKPNKGPEDQKEFGIFEMEL